MVEGKQFWVLAFSSVWMPTDLESERGWHSVTPVVVNSVLQVFSRIFPLKYIFIVELKFSINSYRLYVLFCRNFVENKFWWGILTIYAERATKKEINLDLANRKENFPKPNISTSAKACACHPPRVLTLAIKEAAFKGMRTLPHSACVRHLYRMLMSSSACPR